jgi:hypothetical protein
MVLRRFRIDPAVVSAPFIATLVDTGLIIYFEIAWLLLRAAVSHNMKRKKAAIGCLFCIWWPGSAELEQQGPALLLAVAVLLLQVLHQQLVLVAPVRGRVTTS